MVMRICTMGRVHVLLHQNDKKTASEPKHFSLVSHTWDLVLN